MKKQRVKTWKELEDLSIKLDYSSHIELLVPSNLYGLKDSIIALNYSDELSEKEKIFEHDKKNNTGTIILVEEL